MELTGLGMRIFDPDNRGGDATLLLAVNQGTITVNPGGLTLARMLKGPAGTGTPADQHFIFNSGTVTSATVVRIDDNDVLAEDRAADWNAVVVSSIIRFEHATDSTKWVSATVSTVTDDTGFTRLGLSSVTASSATPFADDDPVVIVVGSVAGQLAVSGNVSSSVTITGSTIELDDLLRGATAATIDYVTSTPGTKTFTMTVTDEDGLVTVEAFTATAATFSSPVVTVPASAYSADADVALNIHGASKFGVTDADDTGLVGEMVLTASAGTIAVTVGNSGCLVTDGNSTDEVTISGTISQLNNLLTGAGSGTIVYTSPSTGTKTFTVAVTDSDGLSDSDSKNVVVYSKPAVSIPSAAFLATTTGAPLNLEGLGFSITDSDASGTQFAQFAVTTGTITITAGTSGITINSGNGTATVLISGTLAQLNNLLQDTGTGTIVFNDSGAANGTITLSVTDDTARTDFDSIAIHVEALAQWKGYAAATPTPSAVTIAGMVGVINLFYMPTDWWTNVTGDGRDIRVTLNDGTTLVPRHLVSFNKTFKTGFLHVKYTSSSTPPRLRVWVGATQATAPAVGDTYGQYATYDSFIKAFYSAGTGNDATVNANHLTTSGTVTASGDFLQSGIAAVYDGAGYGTCAISIPTNEPYTMTAVVKPSAVSDHTVMSVDRGSRNRHMLSMQSSRAVARSAYVTESPPTVFTGTDMKAQAVGTLTTGTVTVLTAAFVSDSRRVCFRDAGNIGTETTTFTLANGATVLYLAATISTNGNVSEKFKGSIGLAMLSNITDEAIIGSWNNLWYLMSTHNPNFWGGSWTYTAETKVGL